MRTNENKSADAPPLTRSVAQFAASTRYEDIPSDVIALSRKAVLDCLGLAFAGSVAEGTILLRRHIASLGCVGGSSTIFGSDMRTHARFAALGDTWQDQEHEKFAEEFRQAMKALKRFVDLSKDHTPYLLRKAQRIEEYLNQR